jgi:hypothetical protein
VPSSLPSADTYMNEPVRYPALTIVDIMAEVPARTIHRTRAIGRTVNLCFEQVGAATVFVDRAKEERL